VKINLDGVEAWKGGMLLPPGVHAVEITDAEEKTSSNGTPQAEFEFRAIGGDHDGGTIRDWLTLTPEAFGRVRQFLEAVRYQIPPGEFEMPTAQLKGRQCVIVVRNELYQGQERTKVKAYQPLQGDIPTPTGVGATNGKDDDDLPF
jgi:hypothetical protein